MMDTNGKTSDLESAINELEQALRSASDAVTRIKDALPRFERMTSVFDELESIIAAGRGESVASLAPAAARAPRTPRVKPAAPAMEANAREEAPAQAAEIQPEEADARAEHVETVAPASREDEKLISFRLEFESNPGPLNLRAVDDAISEHPAVRDVALLDYDGRRAALKVWIAEPATPAEVQSSLSERATTISGDGRQVSIVALEDVA
jgi:hypothetical protein